MVWSKPLCQCFDRAVWGHLIILLSRPHVSMSLRVLLSLHCSWVVWSLCQEYSSSQCPYVPPTCLRGWQCSDKGCPCNIMPMAMANIWDNANSSWSHLITWKGRPESSHSATAASSLGHKWRQNVSSCYDTSVHHLNEYWRKLSKYALWIENLVMKCEMLEEESVKSTYWLLN